MFTIEQIKTAHSKVKSGIDFPEYVNTIKRLGVVYYETFVTDGHTDYYGVNGFKVSSAGNTGQRSVADASNEKKFTNDLKAHQQGKTDYTKFCDDAAASGVEKWAVSTDEMTCTYFNKSGSKVLEELIPG
jgi:uncharacterized protein YbcV (DUF1398 family)